MRTARTARTARALQPTRPTRPVAATVKRQRRAPEDAEYTRWVKAVGETRARSARAVQIETWPEGKRTLIELLTEAWLKEQGIIYQTQVELGFARPDFVVMMTRPDPTECVVWNIHGDYWHTPRAWHDYGKANSMIGLPVQGATIADVIEIWESDLLQDDAVLWEAWRGERRRN